MSGFCLRSLGLFCQQLAFPRYKALDEMDEACGDILKSLEGGRIGGILVVRDSPNGEHGEWFHRIVVTLGLSCLVRYSQHIKKGVVIGVPFGLIKRRNVGD